LALAVYGIGLRRHADKQDAKWRDAPNTTPTKVTLDLSRVGVTHMDVKRPLALSHAVLRVTLETEPPLGSGERITDPFDGVVGLHAAGPDGKILAEKTVRLSDLVFSPLAERSSAALLDVGGPFGQGEYQVSLTVSKPAAHLERTRQELVAWFDFCPCEFAMPAFIGRLIAWACFILSALLALLTLWGVLRIRRHHQACPRP
jgi:hypothetical protein